MNKIIVLSLLLFIVSCATPPPEEYSTPGDITNISVKVKQMTALEAKNPEVKHCTAKIEVFEKQKKHKKIEFKDMIPVKNGPYGVMFLEKRFPQHHVVIKQGDYDGRTLFIDGYGKVVNLKGGNRYVRHKDKVYIYFDSDLLGYSIFDLANNKEENPTVDVDRPFQFARCADNPNLLIKIGRLIYEVDTGREYTFKRGTKCGFLPVKTFTSAWKNCVDYN